MPPRRMVSLAFVLLAAVPWSAALTVLGMWLLVSDHAVGPLRTGWQSVGVGLSAVACGQLVFMLCVCDRVFPRVSRYLSVPAEVSMGLGFVGGLAVAGLSVLSQGGSA